MKSQKGEELCVREKMDMTILLQTLVIRHMY